MAKKETIKNIYFVGGSPCAGKSTICEIISQKYDLYYFKVDDYLDDYMKLAVERKELLCTKNMQMSQEEIWMRDPLIQTKEEFGIYEEIFPNILDDLKKIKNDKAIITEGCAYVPNLIKQLGIPNSKYIAIVPTKEFQVSHYEKRNYVPLMLKECSDKEKAFQNWMERDSLFAKEVARQCKDNDCKLIVNDGTIDVNDLVAEVVKHFEIK